ncbi:hypothetical protein BOTBODRAFT_107463 [Botryobasidium botryosum FD-172 SS1]|uniref:Uncharacterized protein n=1 Tax=Botryobasidium botryosum (strain FD-172 SS1) TaxID=930990 RepID=A0A067MK76_BOTB1|nr:hypothetical protein BOTBODRAFT_107463 [Botryobasidium botryosum FD-172 SS1]
MTYNIRRTLIAASLLSVRFIPSWSPGAAWKRNVKKRRKMVDRMVERPLQRVKAKLVDITDYWYNHSNRGSTANIAISGGRNCPAFRCISHGIRWRIRS